MENEVVQRLEQRLAAAYEVIADLLEQIDVMLEKQHD